MTLDELHRIRNEELRITASHPFHMVLCPHCRADVTESSVIVCSRHCEYCGTRVIDADPEGDEATPAKVTALPTVQQYLDELNSYRRLMRWEYCLLACAGLAGFVIGPLIHMTIPGETTEWQDHVMSGWLYVSMPLALVVAAVVFAIRIVRVPMLSCPQCREAAVDSSEYIISSRCCVKCGVRQLLENPVTKESPQPLYSLASVIEHRKLFERIRRFTNIIVKFILVAFVLVPIFISCFAKLNLVVVHVMAYCILATVMLIYIAYINLIQFLRCTHCRGRLRNYGIIIATKHCDHCGERVIAKPDTLPPEIGHDAG